MLKEMGCAVRILGLASFIALAATTEAAAIFGGTTASPRAYPFMVSMRIVKDDSAFVCGGTLIAQQWVLTAAHCLEGVSSPNDVRVYLGSDKRWDGDEILASQFWVHPGFNDLIDNDIALVRLTRPPRAGMKISTIALSTDLTRYEDLPPGNDPTTPEGGRALIKSFHRDVKVAGWGMLSPAKTSTLMPEALHVIDLRVTKRGYCEVRWNLTRLTVLQKKFESFGLNYQVVADLMNTVMSAAPHRIPAASLCASSLVDMFGNPVGAGVIGGLLGRGPEYYRVQLTIDPGDCPGDSGGPLFETDPNGQFVQVGIVSFGPETAAIHCGSAAAPSVYTNVAYFDAWIRSVMSGR